MKDPIVTCSGVYELTNRQYHSQEVADLPSISSTGLREIDSKSPAHFWNTWVGNPNAEPVEQSRALNFGSAAHSFLLERRLPEDEYIEQPFSDYVRNEDGWNVKAKRKWRDDQIEAGRVIYTAEDMDVIVAMAETLASHPMVRDGALSGRVERAIFLKDEENGCYLKAKPDVIPADGYLIDYKTAASGHPEKIEREIFDRGYHIQMAMAADLIKRVEGIEITHAALLVQEKTRPYVVSLYPLSDQYMDAGHFQYQRAYAQFVSGLQTGEWPGYPDTDMNLPFFHRRRLEAEGFLPPEQSA